MRRLAAAATYLYQDGNRFWYDTQATVTKLAEDRAEQLKRDQDKVMQELDKRLRDDLRRTGDFSRIHPLPRSGADVPDDMDARLVVLSADHPYSKDASNAAEVAAKAILESRGNTPRLYRNSLVFLAVDKVRLQDLDEALRKYLAWASILAEKESLNLSPFQAKQAETQKSSADGAVTARLPEAYQWLLVPEQANPQAPVVWETTRITSVNNPAHLIGSHIKPWRESNNDERLAAGNGLLLTPTADHLFDRGFISFEDNGDVIISPVADLVSLKRMGLDSEHPPRALPLNSDQKHFLEFHRKEIFLAGTS